MIKQDPVTLDSLTSRLKVEDIYDRRCDNDVPLVTFTAYCNKQDPSMGAAALVEIKGDYPVLALSKLKRDKYDPYDAYQVALAMGVGLAPVGDLCLKTNSEHIRNILVRGQTPHRNYHLWSCMYPRLREMDSLSFRKVNLRQDHPRINDPHRVIDWLKNRGRHFCRSETP